MNTKRSYKRHSYNSKVRVVETWKIGGDWKRAAAKDGVNKRTAYGWIAQYKKDSVNTNEEYSPKVKSFKKPQGRRPTLTEEEREIIVQFVREKPFMTADQIRRKVNDHFSVTLSANTIRNYLKIENIVRKRMKRKGQDPNSAEIKSKRQEYLTKLRHLETKGKVFIFIDEMNFRLSQTTNFGYIVKGEPIAPPRSQEEIQNPYIIGAIGEMGVIHWSIKRGALKKDDFNQWIATMMEKIIRQGFQPQDVVLVYDNAPWHASLESNFEDTEFTLLRLGPYSGALNPIELLWLKVRGDVKNRMRAMTEDLPNLEEEDGMHAKRILIEDCIRKAMEGASLSASCEEYFAKVKQYFQAVENLDDLPPVS